MIDIKEILDILPHRYPFLMVDRIIELELNVRAVGIKNVTVNDNFFQGHFPGNPIMPGVLLVEALAQVGGILASKSGATGKAVYFLSIEKVKFRKPVVPGDQLILDVRAVHVRGNVWRFSGNAFVGDKTAAEAEFTAMVTEKEL